MSGSMVPKHGRHRTMGSDKSDDLTRFLDNIFDLEPSGGGAADTVMAGSCPIMPDELLDPLSLPDVQVGEPLMHDPVVAMQGVMPAQDTKLDDAMSNFIHNGDGTANYVHNDDGTSNYIPQNVGYHNSMKAPQLEPLCLDAFPNFESTPKQMQPGFGQSPSSCHSTATPVAYPAAADSDFCPNFDITAMSTSMGADNVCLKRSRVTTAFDNTFTMPSPHATMLTPRERDTGLKPALEVIDLSGVDTDPEATCNVRALPSPQTGPPFSQYLPTSTPASTMMDMHTLQATHPPLHMIDFMPSAMDADDIQMVVDADVEAMPPTMPPSSLEPMDLISNTTITTSQPLPIPRIVTPPPGHFASVVTGLSAAPSSQSHSQYLNAPMPAQSPSAAFNTHVTSPPSILIMPTPQDPASLLSPLPTSPVPPLYHSTAPSPRMTHASPRDRAVRQPGHSPNMTQASPRDPTSRQPGHSPRMTHASPHELTLRQPGQSPRIPQASPRELTLRQPGQSPRMPQASPRELALRQPNQSPRMPQASPRELAFRQPVQSPRITQSSASDPTMHQPGQSSQTSLSHASPATGSVTSASPVTASPLTPMNSHTPMHPQQPVVSPSTNPHQLNISSLLGLHLQQISTPSPRTLMPPPPPVMQTQSIKPLESPAAQTSPNAVFSPVYPTPHNRPAATMHGAVTSPPYHPGLPHLTPIRGTLPPRGHGSGPASPYPGTPASYPNTPTTSRTAVEFPAQQTRVGPAPSPMDADAPTAALPSPTNKQAVMAEMKELLMVMDRLENQQRQLTVEMQALEGKDGGMGGQGGPGGAFTGVTPVSSDLKQTINQVEQTNGVLRQEMDSLLQQVAALS